MSYPEQPPSIGELVHQTPADTRITSAEAATLMAYAAEADPRIPVTDGAADAWFDALAGGRFGVARDAIRAYMARRPADAPVLTPRAVRDMCRDRARRDKHLAQLDQPPKPREGGPPPPHIAAKLAAFKNKHMKKP